MTARILVALPEGAALQTCCDELAVCGYAVASVCTGLLCLQKLVDATFDLLVVDAELPWGGGAGVVEVLAAEPSLRDLPVILLSAGPRTRDSSPNLAACVAGPYAAGLLPPLLHTIFSVSGVVHR